MIILLLSFLIASSIILSISSMCVCDTLKLDILEKQSWVITIFWYILIVTKMLFSTFLIASMHTLGFFFQDIKSKFFQLSQDLYIWRFLLIQYLDRAQSSGYRPLEGHDLFKGLKCQRGRGAGDRMGGGCRCKSGDLRSRKGQTTQSLIGPGEVFGI